MFGYIRVQSSYSAEVLFYNPGIFARHTDFDLVTEHITSLHLSFLGVVVAGGFEHGGKRVMAICCVLF